MAKTTVTHITDDINGDSDAETIEFSYKGRSYVIDLAEKNQTKFDKVIDPFISAATPVRSSSSSRRSSSSSATRDFSVIRAWAKSEGFEVSERGRVPKHIVEQYDATN